MTFPKYEAYRPCEASWISQIPKHWESTSLKRIASLRSGDSITSDSIQDEGEYPVFGGNGVRGFTSSFTHSGNHPIIGRQGALCGNINYAEGRFWASEHAVVASPLKEVSIRWLGETLRAMDLNQYSVSAAQPGLSVETISNLLTPYPPIEEQLAIASFLDRETAKIDALIAEQQHLIELLQEKRQAVISHAVTKGLNPDAPMKDSGVEWLGEVPEHWRVVQVRRITRTHKQGFYSSEGYVEHGVNLLRITDIKSDGSIDTLESPKVDGNSVPNEFLLEEGDFVFARTGGAGSYGFIGELDSPTAFASYLIRFRFADSVERGFLRIYFLSQHFLEGIASSIHGGVNQNVHAEDIKNQWLALPPQEEQRTIALQVFSELERYVALGSSIEDEIKLLNERRSALISAAVTGQIDVRGLAAEEEP